MDLKDPQAIVGAIAALLSVLTAIVSLAVAFRNGALKRISLGPLEIEAPDRNVLEKIKREIQQAPEGAQPLPFEIEQLASYYSQVLGQARTSFWFSLIFASVGFLIIVASAFLFTQGDLTGALLKLTSGIIVDAVAALFFVQSKRAQESMSAFFDKLRNDRQFIEARKMCDEISDESYRDKIKTVLVLHYSGLDATGLIGDLNGRRAPVPEPQK